MAFVSVDPVAANRASTSSGARSDRFRNGRRRAAWRISSLYALPTPAMKPWFFRRFFSSPGMATDPLAPDVQGQCRRRRRRVPIRCRTSPARFGRARPAAGRPCPSGSGRGTELPRFRRRTASRSRASSSAAGRFGGAVAGTEREHDRCLRRQLLAWTGQLEPAGEHRVDDHAIPVEVDEQELAPPADVGDPLADECFELGRRPPHGKGSGGRHGRDRTPDEGGVEGLGDNGQIGQFGHGRPIVAARNRVLDSPGSGRQHS